MYLLNLEIICSQLIGGFVDLFVKSSDYLVIMHWWFHSISNYHIFFMLIRTRQTFNPHPTLLTGNKLYSQWYIGN